MLSAGNPDTYQSTERKKKTDRNNRKKFLQSIKEKILGSPTDVEMEFFRRMKNLIKSSYGKFSLQTTTIGRRRVGLTKNISMN